MSRAINRITAVLASNNEILGDLSWSPDARLVPAETALALAGIALTHMRILRRNRRPEMALDALVSVRQALVKLKAVR